MIIPNKIALSIPDAEEKRKYFSLKVKQHIDNEHNEYDRPSKILVMADIEGNFRAFCKLLNVNGVINRNLKWTFDDGHLVIVGDCFDRGEQVVECLWLIYSLEERARRNGGYVHFILGNHEIMNMNGDWRYVHPKYASSSRIPFTALYNGNNELWNWLRTKNIIEKIGDILFVHAGIAPELLQLNLSISEINNLARPFYTHANKQFTDNTLHTIFNSEQSPFWYRGYYQNTITEDQIDATLQHFGVKTIVTGHTVVDKVTAFFNGKVINVDTDHASGNSEALFIKKDRFYRVDKNGKRERIK